MFVNTLAILFFLRHTPFSITIVLEVKIVKNIKVARALRGIKQADLANRIGVSQGSVSAWERGTKTPSAENLHAMAQVLNVSMEYLLSVVEQKQQPPAKHTASLSTNPNVTMTREEMHRLAAEEGVELSPKNIRQIMKLIEELYEDLSNPASLMFSGADQYTELDQDTIIALRAALETAIVVAKANAKKTFTSKKYQIGRAHV